MKVTLYLLDNIYSGNFIIFKRPTPAISATHGARFNLLFPKYKKKKRFEFDGKFTAFPNGLVR